MTRVVRRATLLVALCALTSAAVASAQADSEEARRQQSGVEGEPIPLESKEPTSNDYLDRVRQMIKRNWTSYPCVRDDATGHCEYKSAELVIEFGILKDGRVPFVIVRMPSGFDVYDQSAVQAIRLASPFPPVPPELMARMKPESTGIAVSLRFEYVVPDILKEVLR